MNAPLVHDERQGLLAFLEHQRQAICYSAYGLTDDQARVQPTPSGLSLGGLIKHVAYGEGNWSDRIEAIPPSEAAFEVYMESFSLSESETLSGVLQQYERASARTDSLIAGIDDLGRRVMAAAEGWPQDGWVKPWRRTS